MTKKEKQRFWTYGKVVILLIAGMVLYMGTAMYAPQWNPLYSAQVNWMNQNNAQEMAYATSAHYVPATSTCTGGFILCDQWQYEPAHVQAPLLQTQCSSAYGKDLGNGMRSCGQCNHSNAFCGAYFGFNESQMPPNPT